METSIEKKVAEVVSENIKAAHVFKKYGIDFCCGGNISIKQACEKNAVNAESLIKDLQEIGKITNFNENFNAWEIDYLVDHILNTHHIYVKETLPVMIQYASKVARVHGEHAPETIRINEIVEEVAVELMNHLLKEEQVLFPIVKEMKEAQNKGEKVAAFHCGSVNNPIFVMEAEHDHAGDAFKEIEKLSNQFTPPEWACNTFKALYSLLKEFQEDLHQHVHLENNILFPKAIALEKSVLN